jgi:hypothetical protein
MALPNKWPTLRIACWGAAVGAGYAFILAWGHWSLGPEWVERNIGALIGGAAGGAFMAAAFSGLRNFFSR